MPDNWQSDTVPFVCDKGLDLIHPVDQVPKGAYTRLTNVAIPFEGSLTSRLGFTAHDTDNQVGAAGATVHSLWAHKDTIASTTSILTAAGTILQANFATVATALANAPKTFVDWQPLEFSGNATYIGDSTRMVKLYYSGGSPVVSDMGLTTPTKPIPPPTITAASATEIDPLTSEVGWTAVNATLTAPATAAAYPVNVSKPTRTAAPGALGAVLQAVVTGANIKATWDKGVTKNLQKGFNANSRIEFYCFISDPADVKELRIIFNLNASLNYADDYYIKVVRGADLVESLAGGDATRLQALRQRIESRVAEQETEDLLADWSRTEDEEPPLFSDETVLGTNQWQAFSFRRREFLRVGANESLDWSNVNGVRFELLTSDSAASTTVRLYELDIVATSGLDSTGGLPYDWVYTEWNDTLRVESNPCPTWASGIPVVRRVVPLSLAPSEDAQVTHLRLYRRGGQLGDYHRVSQLEVATTVTTAFVKTVTTGFYTQLETSATAGGAPAAHSITAGSLVRVKGIAGTGTITELNGVWRVTSVPTSSTMIVTAAVTGTMTNNTGTVSTVTTQDSASDEDIVLNPPPPFDHFKPFVTLRTRTNSLTRSNEFANAAWTKTSLTALAADALGPFSGQDAVLLTADANDATLSRQVTLAAGLRTFSIYLKRKKGTGAVSLINDDGAGAANLSAVPLTSFPDGHWQRFQLTARATNPRVGVRLAVITDEVWAFGAQLETGATATDYIPTTTAAVSETDISQEGKAVPVLIGPFMDKYILGLGDTNRPGVLYWTNTLNPDAASPINTLDVTSAAEPLQNGGILDGRAYILSTERMYVIYPNITGEFGFIALPTACTYGAWSRYAVAFGPRIWFLSSVGIMESTGDAPANITENSWVRPLFQGLSVNGYSPVDFTAAASDLQFVFQEPHLYFVYKAADATKNVLKYHTTQRRWIHWTLNGISPTCGLWHRRGTTDKLLLGAADGWVYEQSGNADVPGGASALPVQCTVRTGALDQGASRGEKLYGDILLEVDRNAVPIAVTPLLNDETVTSDAITLSTGTGRRPYLIQLTPQDAALVRENRTAIGRSLSLHLTWDSSVARPFLHSADIAYIASPDVRTFRPTDWDSAGVPFQKYVWGASLDIDTFGAGLDLQVWADGVQQTVVPVPAGAGRRTVELSWPVFRAYQMRLAAEHGVEYMLYTHTWYHAQEAPQLTAWHTQWETPTPSGDGYVTGCALRTDTKNVAKTVIFERDGGVFMHSAEVRADGHQLVYVTFPNAFRAGTVRLRSEDAVSAYLYTHAWIATPEPPGLALWDSNYEGDLQDEWISGLYLDCDTGGAPKSLQLAFDGADFSTPLTVQRSTRGPVKLSFGPVRAAKKRFYTLDTNPGRLWEHRWISEPEPVELSNFGTNWEDGGWPFDKVLKGVALECDTGGVTKRMALRTNGLEEDVAFFEVLTTGRDIRQFHFDNLMVRTYRLVPTDSNLGRLYSKNWIVDREPPELHRWETQESAYWQGTWFHMREAYICLRSSAPVTLTVSTDGTSVTYTIASTSRERRKLRISLKPVPGLLFKFLLTSPEPFKVYNEDNSIYAKPHGSPDAYKTYAVRFEGGT